MALVRADRVFETSTTTGTGSLSLGGPVAGYRSFASVMSTNDTCYYTLAAVDSSGRPTGDWETGIGTLTASTTLARTSILASSNGGAAVSLSAGSKHVFLTLTSSEISGLLADVAAKSPVVQVDIYSSNDTWTKPTGAKFHDIYVFAGGSGGRSGGLDANATLGSITANGGSGGQPGGYAAFFKIPSAVLTSTVAITVGAGGTGGASITSEAASGSTGTAGGNSSFGSYLSATGGNTNAGSGAGGTITSGVGANGNNAETGSSTGPVAPYISNTGTLSATTQVFNAGTNATGGALATGSNVTTTGATGGNGSDLSGDYQRAGGGAGGGTAVVTSAGAATSTIGGDGGNGGIPAGAGGGGGAAGAQRSTLPTGSRSGKGGNGGRGEVIVVTWF